MQHSVVKNTNLQPISHRLQDAAYWSNFPCRRESSLTQFDNKLDNNLTIIWGEPPKPLNSGLRNLASKTRGIEVK